MTRGSDTPLVPLLEDPESALRKSKGKAVGETTSSKNLPLKNLKSVFSKKKGSNLGASSASLVIEDPIKEDIDYESEEEEELAYEHESDPEEDLAIIMANIDEAQVFYSSDDRYDENWRKPKKDWLPYEEYKKAKEEKYKKKRGGFIQRKNRVMPGEKVEAYRAFMEHVKALQVNVPFVETMLQTPKYFNLLKHLFAARKDLAEVAEIILSELPKEKGDPGSIIIMCQFGNALVAQALTDSGASINLMPFSFFKKLNLPEPRSVNMKIHLADKTAIYPRGVCEDLLIKVDKFIFPVDFVVLDMEEDPEILIILGRSFLNTACALIDICESTLTLRVGDESAIFRALPEIKQEEISFIDFDDEILQKELALLQEEDPSKFLLPSGSNGDFDKDLEEIEKLLKGADSENTVEIKNKQ
ncbi:uncharacterized protein LOC128133656 [Lactuca sativa]|uniref:uncharacterized protein LOC128133656 n=1 Tax=Lactuca sativa TaxID=4236 RepID=UPI0022AFD6EA|nr:uncharacterized protein LOC128133656 [Lactuca sativa]